MKLVRIAITGLARFPTTRRCSGRHAHRLAIGDLFLGPYQALVATLSSRHPAETLGNA